MQHVDDDEGIKETLQSVAIGGIVYLLGVSFVKSKTYEGLRYRGRTLF